MFETTSPARSRSLMRVLLPVALAVAAVGTAVAGAPAPAQADECGGSQAFIAVGLGGPSLVEGGGYLATNTSVNLYPAAVAAPGTFVTFRFTAKKDGKLIREHTTAPVRSNCVVHHEPEEFAAAKLGVRTVLVDVTYQRHEDNSTVTRHLGSLGISEGGQGRDHFPGPCDQPSAAWAAVVGTSTSLLEGGGRIEITTSDRLVVTGIVARGIVPGASFHFAARDGRNSVTKRTEPARGNCIIHQEPIAEGSLLPGTYDVSVAYPRHETGMVVSANLGILSVG